MDQAKLARLERQYQARQEEWELRNARLRELRSAFAIEAGSAVQFQLRAQIQTEEDYLARLEDELAVLEAQLKPRTSEKGNQDDSNVRGVEEVKTQKEAAISVFCSYSARDEAYYQALAKHLAVLRRQGLVSSWSSREIEAGDDWQEGASDQLRKATIVLLLVSADYVASDYPYTSEMTYALEKHRAGELRVIPIIVRPVDWSDAPFGRLQALPRDGRAISQWDDQDRAFLDVIQAIRRTIEQSKAEERSLTIEVDTPRGFENIVEPAEFDLDLDDDTLLLQHSYLLSEVFKASGVPEITFVEPPDFEFLKQALVQPGRGVVIEGPSGIGKTTALKKAIAQLELDGKCWKVDYLSARIPKDVEQLKTIDTWQEGIVAIDDFHLLDPDLRHQLADRLKYLADQETAKKIVIVGIPYTKAQLIEVGYDIATRVEVISMDLSKTSDFFVLQMIEQGELALNVSFLRKAEIVNIANGSLNIAQMLCARLATREKVTETQSAFKAIRCDLEEELQSIRQIMDLKFGEFIRFFCLLNGRRNPNCINLLLELAKSETASLSFIHAKKTHPQLRLAIDDFINQHYIDKLETEYPKYKQYLFYDKHGLALVINDPQLVFYLRQFNLSSLCRAIGMSEAGERDKVFISYSRNDSEWLKRLQIYLKPFEKKGLLDRWDDTRIKTNMKWKEEIKKALDSARIAILLVSSNFLASDFIEDFELPPLLKAAKDEEASIFCIILDPCETAFSFSDLEQFQTLNPPNHPISGMEEHEWKKTFDRLSKEILETLDLAPN